VDKVWNSIKIKDMIADVGDLETFDQAPEMIPFRDFIVRRETRNEE
jgi:hypothetical protein